MSTLRVDNIQLNQAGNATISIANSYNVVISVDGTEKMKFGSSGVNINGEIRVNDNLIIDQNGDISNYKGRKIEATAIGSIPNNFPVVLNSNGTVSAVSASSDNIVVDDVSNIRPFAYTYNAMLYSNTAQKLFYADGDVNSGNFLIGEVSANGQIVFGSETTFSSDEAAWNDISYDEVTQNVVVAYSDTVSITGKYALGLISGNTATFTPGINFNSASTTKINVIYDKNAGRHVFTYADTGNRAIVGQITGNTMTFGSEATLAAGAVSDAIVSTYDSINGKVIVAYIDPVTDIGNAKVGTVSGSTISFGANTTFSQGSLGSAGDGKIAIDFSANTGKIVAAYYLRGNVESVVGTVSGTNISFGANTVIFKGTSSSSVTDIRVVCNPENNEVFVTYKDEPVNNKFYAYISKGKISGDTITFSNQPAIIGNTYSGSYSIFSPKPQYIDSVKKFLYASRTLRSVDSNYFYTTNMDGDNFVGISDAAYSNGEIAKVQIVGGVNAGQTNLTPGKKYYVSANGNLNSFALTNPPAYAGLALSSTELIIKG